MESAALVLVAQHAVLNRLCTYRRQRALRAGVHEAAVQHAVCMPLSVLRGSNWALRMDAADQV